MTDAQYETKFKDMRKYIPFLRKVIEELKVNNVQEEDNSRQTRLQQIEKLHEFLTNKPKQLKMETLMKFDRILIKFHDRYEKQQKRKMQNQDYRLDQHHNTPEQPLSSDKQIYEEHFNSLENDKRQQLCSDNKKYKENINSLEDDKRDDTVETLTSHDKNDHHEEFSKDICNTIQYQSHHNKSEESNSLSPTSVFEKNPNVSGDSHTPYHSPQKTFASNPPTTEYIPVHTTQQHATSYLQQSTQHFKPGESICHSNLKTLPQVSNQQDNHESIWEQYNESPTYKSPKTLLSQLDDKVSETSYLRETSSKIICKPGHCDSLSDVLKTLSLSSNDINSAELSLDENKLSSDITKTGSKMPETSVAHEKDNVSDNIPIDALKPSSPTIIYTNQSVMDLDRKYNDRSTCKSPQSENPQSSPLDDKVSDTTSLSATDSATNFLPGHCDSPADVLKNPSLPIKDINKPQFNLDQIKLAKDTSKKGSHILQTSEELEKDVSSDIVMTQKDVNTSSPSLSNTNQSVLHLEEYKVSNDISKMGSRSQQTSVEILEDNATDIIIISSDDEEPVKEIDTNKEKRRKIDTKYKEKCNDKDFSEKSSKKTTEATTYTFSTTIKKEPEDYDFANMANKANITNDINNPEIHLNEHKLLNDITKIGSKMPQTAVELEKTIATSTELNCEDDELLNEVSIIGSKSLLESKDIEKHNASDIINMSSSSGNDTNQSVLDLDVYNQQYNDRPTCKSPKTVSSLLDNKFLKTTSLSVTDLAPGHNDQLQDVLKRPSLPTNDMNMPVSNLNKYKLSNDIYKNGSKAPPISVKLEKDNPSDIVMIQKDDLNTSSPSASGTRSRLASVEIAEDNASDIIIISSDDEEPAKEIQTYKEKVHKYATKDEEKCSNKDFNEKSSKKINKEICEIPTEELKPQRSTAEDIVNHEKKLQDCIDSITTNENPYESPSASSCSSTFSTNLNDVPTTSSYTLFTTIKKEPDNYDLANKASTSNNFTPTDSQHILKILGKLFREDRLETTIKKEITEKQISVVKEECKEGERRDDIYPSSETTKIQSQTFIPTPTMINSELNSAISQTKETNITKSSEHSDETQTTVKRMEAKIDASKPLRITIKIYTNSTENEKDKTKDNSLKGNIGESTGKNEDTSLQAKVTEEPTRSNDNSCNTSSTLTNISLNYQVNNENLEQNSDTEIEMETETINCNFLDPAEKLMLTKNTNINWHNQSEYVKLCLICNRKLPPKTGPNHYKTHHGENYISRLAPDLLHKFKHNQFQKPIYGVDRTPKQTTWYFRCPFCLDYLNIPTTAWLQHFQSHTAELRYECSQCHKCNNHAYIIRKHIQDQCKGATLVCSDAKQTSSTMIKAHVCHLCNFMQLKRDNLDSHYIMQHQLQPTNLSSLGYTIKLFDTRNVEMVEADGDIQEWKSPNKIEDIIEESYDKNTAEEVKNELNKDFKSNPLTNPEITSRKRKEKSQKEKSLQNRTTETIENLNDNSHSESEMENESSTSEIFFPEEVKNGEKSVKPKNTNIHWHNQSKYTKVCMICEKNIRGKCSAFHYNMHHGENYISRLAPEVLEEFKQGQFYRPLFGVEKKTSNPSWFYRCPFCLKYFNTSISVWLQHFKDHTAEFLFECSLCHRGHNSRDKILRHINYQCKEASVVRSDVNRSIHTLIKSYVCHLCNFMQLKRSNLDRHYLEQHLFEKKDIAQLGYTLTLFDAHNVEMLAEDVAIEKENEILKSINSKEQENQEMETFKSFKESHKEDTPKYKSVYSEKDLGKQNDFTKESSLLRFSNIIPKKNSSKSNSSEPQLEAQESLTPTKNSHKPIICTTVVTVDSQHKSAGLNTENPKRSDGSFDRSAYLASSLLPLPENRTSKLVVAAKNCEDIPNQNSQSFTSNTTTNSSNCEFSNANPNDEIFKTSPNFEDGEKIVFDVTSSFFTLDHEFVCFHCKFITQKFYDLETHYQSVHNSSLETAKSFWFFINFKSQHFPQGVPKLKNEHLMDILKLGEPQSSYQCSLCLDIFPNSVAIVEHACSEHAGEDNFSLSPLKNTLIYRCFECCFSSTKEIDLLRHMIDHYGRFQNCNFCADLQSSFVGYMQHCYAEHKEDIRRFRELYPLFRITKYLLNMLLVFPNGLILKKVNLLKTVYGKTKVIDNFYEEMCKISQQPPIPRLSIANLVAQHKINSLSSPQELESELKFSEFLKAKKILKRRYTVAVNQKDNIVFERKHKLANEALIKPNMIKQRRNPEDQQNEITTLDLLQLNKISKRRRTVAIDYANLSSNSTG